MNKDQIKGELKIIAGKFEEAVGGIVANPKQQLNGQSKQITGHVQKGIGNIKQAVDDIADDAGSNID